MSQRRTAARIQSAASVNNTLVKTGFTVALCGMVGNNGAGNAYIKFYDKATAPTVGTDTPVLTYALQATSAFSFQVPFGFATGIGFGLVTGAADADNTAVGAGDVLGLSIVYG